MDKEKNGIIFRLLCFNIDRYLFYIWYFKISGEGLASLGYPDNYIKESNGFVNYTSKYNI